MSKKVSDSQVAGIKAHAEAKNKETIDKVNKAIDKLKRKNKPINFETVYSTYAPDCSYPMLLLQRS